MKNAFSLCRHAALAVIGAAALWAPSLVMAGTTVAAPLSFWVDIDDGSETMAASVNDGSYLTPTTPCVMGGVVRFPGSCVITQETTTGLGEVAITTNYHDLSPLPAGQQITLNFNIFEAGNPQLVSDTLTLTFRGVAGQPGPLAVQADPNTLVSLRFLSGSLNELVNPPRLPDAISVGENFDVSALIAQNTGLSDAHVRFVSDVEGVPEPATLTLLGIALAGVGFSRRKQWPMRAQTGPAPAGLVASGIAIPRCRSPRMNACRLQRTRRYDWLRAGQRPTPLRS